MAQQRAVSDLPSQRDNRVWRVFTDQHGRKLGAWADKGNQRPIGEFQPQGFNPPWMPPMRYAQFDAEGGLEFRWDYDTMAQEWGEMGASYYSDATKFALEHNLPVPEIGGTIDRRIRDVFKDPPKSPAIPLAAKAGDPWLLGRPGASRNEELFALLNHGARHSTSEFLEKIRDRIVPQIVDPVVPPSKDEDKGSAVTWPKFLAAMRKKGKTMQEAASAWALVKDAIAADSDAEAATV